MITLRLDPGLEQTIKNTARNLGLSKSELIRKSVLAYLDKLAETDPAKAGEDLFGRYSSGQPGLSSCRKRALKEKIRAKRA